MSKGIFEKIGIIILNVVCFLLIDSSQAYAQRISNLSLNFVRSINKDSKYEKISGEIFYTDSVTIVKVSFPLNQWLFYKKDGIVIYYPENKTALKINSTSPAFLPFFHSILGLVDENFNLDKLQYTIVKRFNIGDTLKIFWAPPKEIKGNIGEYHVSLFNDRIVSIENFDNKRKLVTLTRFENYEVFSNKSLPTKTITYTYIKKTRSIEEVDFSNISINNIISDQIKYFAIPQDTKITNLEW